MIKRLNEDENFKTHINVGEKFKWLIETINKNNGGIGYQLTCQNRNTGQIKTSKLIMQQTSKSRFS